jgi:hypothetical protein
MVKVKTDQTIIESVNLIFSKILSMNQFYHHQYKIKQNDIEKVEVYSKE